LSKVVTLQVFIALALAAAEPSVDQASNVPSIALLLYLDEFAGIDEEVVDLAVLCANHSDQQNNGDSAVQALAQCGELTKTTADLRQPKNSE